MSSEAPFRRVLHIEDSETDAFIVKRGLRKVKGVEIDWVTTGREGLARASKGTYDLVLLDYALPDMTGLEVLVRLSELPDSAPVVMVSGFGSEFVAVRGMSLGAVGYVNKDTPEFKDHLAELLEQLHAEGQDRRRAKANAERIWNEPSARRRVEQVVDDLAKALGGCRGVFLAGPEGLPLATSAPPDRARGGDPGVDVLGAMAAASVTRNLDVVGNAVSLGRPRGGVLLHARGSLVYHPVRGVGDLVAVLDREAAWARDGKELAQAVREIESLAETVRA